MIETGILEDIAHKQGRLQASEARLVAGEPGRI
jgi:hypothetical protein